MENLRKNTVSLDLRIFSERLTPLEIHLLIQDKLELAVEEVDAIELVYNKVYIKVKNREIVERILAKYETGKIEIKKGEDLYNIPIQNEDNLTTVRIHYIPISVPSDVVSNVLKNYGNILSVKNETWGKNLPFPVPTGVRAYTMYMTRPIPSFIVVLGRKTLVTYPGQIKTCKICNSSEHFSDACPRSLAKRLATVRAEQPIGYAAAVLNQTNKPLGEKTILNNGPRVEIEAEKTLALHKEGVMKEVSEGGNTETVVGQKIMQEMEKHRNKVYKKSEEKKRKKAIVGSTSEEEEKSKKPHNEQTDEMWYKDDVENNSGGGAIEDQNNLTENEDCEMQSTKESEEEY